MKRSNNNDIDRLFQSHFDMHDVPVNDRDQLWNRIQPKKNRRFLPFLLLLGLISAIGLSASLVQKGPISANQNIASLNSIESISGNTPSNKRINTLDRIVEEQKDFIPLKESTEEKVESTVSKSYKPASKNRLPNAVRPKSLKPNYSSNTEVTEKVEKIRLPKSHNSHSAIPKIITYSENVLAEGNSVANKKEKNSGFIANNREVSIASLSNLSIGPFSTTITSLEISGLFKKDRNPLDDCMPGFGGHPYLDVYTILGMPMEQSALASGSEDQTGYLSDWNERYAALPSVSLGIMLGYEFASGLDIAIGAEYQKMQSQYKTTQTIIESVTVYDPMAYFFYDDNNEVVWVGDSVTATSTYDRTVAVANIHSLIHVPLQVSYPLIRKGPWNIKASAAAALNLSFQYRGQFLRADNSLVQIDAANQSSYLSPNIGLSFELGGHLGYNISQNWEAYISPRFRYNQHSYLAETQVISLSRNFVNLRAGVQYHF